MPVLKHIGVSSLAKMLACLYFFPVFIVGTLFMILVIILGIPASDPIGIIKAMKIGIFVGYLLAITIAPIIGAIEGAILAIIYNFVADIAGGIEYD